MKDVVETLANDWEYLVKRGAELSNAVDLIKKGEADEDCPCFVPIIQARELQLVVNSYTQAIRTLEYVFKMELGVDVNEIIKEGKNGEQNS